MVQKNVRKAVHKDLSFHSVFCIVLGRIQITEVELRGQQTQMNFLLICWA